MKCKYTKQQIIESIKHWQKCLQLIDEAEDQLLKALSDAFEKSKLFSKTYKGKFNEDFFRKAYDILNEHFHNTLTFEDMKDKANELGINVIQEISNGKNAEILDEEAIKCLMKKIENNDSLNEKEISVITNNPSTFISKSNIDNQWHIITF